MHLTSSQLRYLFVLKQIKEERGAEAKIKLEDLSDALRVSKPSVHRMMAVFKGMGLLEEKRGIAGLTELGEEMADYFEKKNQIIFQHLKNDLTLSDEAANAIALSILGCEEPALQEYIDKITD